MVYRENGRRYIPIKFSVRGRDLASTIQEAQTKWPALRAATANVRLHCIGRLQSNRAADAVGIFDTIHSLDRLSLHHISHQAARRGYQLCDDELDEEGCPVDSDMLTEAEARFRRGDIAEALIWLERALPDTFAGLSTAAVPACST